MEIANWDAIAAMAEVVGVVGVIASLIFVGFQMRQTAKAIGITSTHAVQEAFRDSVLRLAESETLSAILHKEVPDPGSGTGLEQYRFALYIQSVLELYANAHYQCAVGALDQSTWRSLDAQIGNFMQTPGLRAYWERSGANYPQAFVSYINDEVLMRSQDQGYGLPGT